MNKKTNYVQLNNPDFFLKIYVCKPEPETEKFSLLFSLFDKSRSEDVFNIGWTDIEFSDKAVVSKIAMNTIIISNKEREEQLVYLESMKKVSTLNEYLLEAKKDDFLNVYFAKS